MLARQARPAAGAHPRPRAERLANWRGRVASSSAVPMPMPAAGTLQVLGPPDSYDFRADVADETRRLVAERYPSLLPLAESGVLIAWRRGFAATASAAAALRGEVAPAAGAPPEPEIVLVLGVAHASARSAADVDAVVRAVRPDNVVVELCRSRASLLGGGGGAGEQGGVGGRESNGNGNADNPVPLGGASSFVGAMSRSLRLGGQAGLVLQLLIGWKAKQALKAAAASATTGTAAAAGEGGAPSSSSSSSSSSPSSVPSSSLAAGGVGVEFRAAASAADAVGAQLVLGDRPIEVTLARAWRASGGPWEKASLLRDLLLSGPPTAPPAPVAAAAAAAGAAAAGAVRAASADGGAADPDDDDGDLSPAAAARRLARVTVSREAAERFAAAAAAAASAPPPLPESLLEAAERLRSDDDAVSAALAALTRAHPLLASPLVHERDAYLAWSLRRSKAVRGSSTVVGVVGAAHMRGVAYCLKHGARYRRGRAPGAAAAGAAGGGGGGDDGAPVEAESSAPLSFADLARPGGPKRTGGERALRAAADVAIGLAAWMAWDMLF